MQLCDDVQTLDLPTCRYGGSRLLFRGPERGLSGEYVLFIGGSETFGRFVRHPFAARIEDQSGIACVNMGCVNAGLDSFAHDPTVIAAARRARRVVLQVMGPEFMSNPFYCVHPRRNDRFLKPTAALRQLYPRLDFSDVTFVGHLLRQLHGANPRQFRRVKLALQDNWIQQMRRMLRLLSGRVLLLWLDQGDTRLILTPTVVERASLRRAELLRIRPTAQVIAQGTQGMVFAPRERRSARAALSRAYHDHIADLLGQRLCQKG